MSLIKNKASYYCFDVFRYSCFLAKTHALIRKERDKKCQINSKFIKKSLKDFCFSLFSDEKIFSKIVKYGIYFPFYTQTLTAFKSLIFYGQFSILTKTLQ